MIHFWAFFLMTILSMLLEVRAKNFYQSFIYFALFAVGIMGLLISLFAYLVSMLIHSIKH